MRLLALLILSSLAVPAVAKDLPVCQGGNRAERKLTCIVDGDTGWERGVKWRLMGTDTPEISRPGCRAEKLLGYAARDRVRELMGQGYTILDSGRRDRSKRALINIRLNNGMLLNDQLLREGLTQPWPNSGNIWCNRHNSNKGLY